MPVKKLFGFAIWFHERRDVRRCAADLPPEELPVWTTTSLTEANARASIECGRVIAADVLTAAWDRLQRRELTLKCVSTVAPPIITMAALEAEQLP